MLSLPQIQRMTSTGTFEKLIDRVLANGRCGNISLRLRLTRSEALMPAALGLALQRCCELTYGPMPLSTDLAGRIIHLQTENGLFRHIDVASEGDTSHPGSSGLKMTVSDDVSMSTNQSLAAAAVALRGLLEFRSQRAEVGMPADSALEAAIDRGIFAIASRQDIDGLIGSDSVESAIILWQLGGIDIFRQAVSYLDLFEAVEASDSDLIGESLRKLACATAA